jgi:hypothetical protein
MPEGFDVDIPDAAFEGADAPAAPTETAPEATPEAPAPAVEAPVAPAVEAPAETAEPTTFPREYVEELRGESANYRTKLREFEAKFEGINEADRDTFLYLMETYKADPAKAAKEMAAIGQAYMDQAGDGEAPADASTKALGPEVMTVEKYQQMRQQEDVETQAGQIRRDAEALGYKAGSPEYGYLLGVAKAGDGDLNKAHAHIEAQHQARIDAFVAQKAQAAEQFPTAPAEASAPASDARSLKTWRDVEAAIDEMF